MDMNTKVILTKIKLYDNGMLKNINSDMYEGDFTNNLYIENGAILVKVEIFSKENYFIVLKNKEIYINI